MIFQGDTLRISILGSQEGGGVSKFRTGEPSCSIHVSLPVELGAKVKLHFPQMRCKVISSSHMELRSFTHFQRASGNEGSVARRPGYRGKGAEEHVFRVDSMLWGLCPPEEVEKNQLLPSGLPPARL